MSSIENSDSLRVVPKGRYWLGALACAMSCAAARADSPATGSEAFDALHQQAREQHSSSEARRYLRRLRSFEPWRDGAVMRAMVLPHEKAILECVTAMIPTPSPVQLAFRVALDGTVTEAFTDQAGYIAECLPRKVIGLRLPAPPHDGFLLCHRVEKDADRSSVTPCAGVGWTERCEQRGTSQSCRIEFKTE